MQASQTDKLSPQSSILKSNLTGPDDWIKEVIKEWRAYVKKAGARDLAFKSHNFKALDDKIEAYERYVAQKQLAARSGGMIPETKELEKGSKASKPVITTIGMWGATIVGEAKKAGFPAHASEFGAWIFSYLDTLEKDKQILGTPKLKRAVDNATAKLSRIVDVSSSTIRSLEAQLSETASSLEEARAEAQRVAQLERTISEYQSRSETLARDIEVIETERAEQESTLQELTRKLAQLKAEAQAVPALRAKLEESDARNFELSSRLSAFDLAHQATVNKLKVAQDDLSQTRVALEAAQQQQRRLATLATNATVRDSTMQIMRGLPQRQTSDPSRPPSPTESMRSMKSTATHRGSVAQDPRRYTSTERKDWITRDDFLDRWEKTESPYHMHVLLATLIVTQNKKVQDLENAKIPLETSRYLFNVQNASGKPTGTILRKLQVDFDSILAQQDPDLDKLSGFLRLEKLCERFWLRDIAVDQFILELNQLSENTTDTIDSISLQIIRSLKAATVNTLTTSLLVVKPHYGIPGLSLISVAPQDPSDRSRKLLTPKVKEDIKQAILALKTKKAIKSVRDSLLEQRTRRRPEKNVDEDQKSTATMAPLGMRDALLPRLNEEMNDILKQLVADFYAPILKNEALFNTEGAVLETIAEDAPVGTAATPVRSSFSS